MMSVIMLPQGTLLGKLWEFRFGVLSVKLKFKFPPGAGPGRMFRVSHFQSHILVYCVRLRACAVCCVVLCGVVLYA